MKKNRIKGFLQKSILILPIVIILNFTVPNYSQASLIGSTNVGGVLITSVVDILCTLGDSIINIVQVCMTGEWDSGEKSGIFNWFMVDESKYEADTEGVKTKNEDQYKDGQEIASLTIDPDDLDKGWFNTTKEYQIPVVVYSPEEIFQGKVPGLDINFINPGSSGKLNRGWNE